MTDDASQSPEPRGKLDPETLVLRGAPPRAVRFRKGAVIGLLALGSGAIATVAWIALSPAGPMTGSEHDSRDLAVSAPPEISEAAPASYDEVPKLGPPLPGDLGKPILDHRGSMAAPGAGRGEGAESERQRAAAEQKAVRESALMMPLSNDVARRSNDTAKQVPSPDRAGDVDPQRLVSTPSTATLSAGSVIAAALITGINSDLPGVVTAQVTQDVHDSLTGRTLLIPQGARLIGRYENDIAFGQERALIVWDRIVLPNGASIQIDALPASDAAGHAGLSDRVERHEGQMLKGLAFSTLLGVGTQLGIDGDGALVQAVREATQQGAAQAGDRIVSRHLDVRPTLTVRPGWPLRVVVSKDLVLMPWRN